MAGDPNNTDEKDEERCGDSDESVPKRFLGSQFHPLTLPHSDTMMTHICYFYWLKCKLQSIVNTVSKNDGKIMINKKVKIF